MKKVIFTVAAFVALSFTSFGQAPEGFKYQAVVRDASSTVITNQAVGMQIVIHQGSATGTPVYTETFAPTTNGYGLVNLEIGTGTTTDDFSLIDWSAGPYFVETLADLTGGTAYGSLGTSQLMSVPYALHAKTVDSVDDADADPNNEIQALSFSNDTLYMSNGGQVYLGAYAVDLVDDADADPNNELQAVSFSNDTLYLSNGGQVYLGAYGVDLVDDADADPSNEIQTLSLVGSDLSIAGGNTITLPASGLTGAGTTDYVTKFTAASAVGNSSIRDDGSVAINGAPNADYQLYVYKQQLTADGDGQSTIYGYRTRDSQNDGVSYANTGGNSGVRGYNYWGDVYTFGVVGNSYNDYTRTGGVLGAQNSGGYWGSLGYKNSGSATYGVYGSAGYASGAGLLPSAEVIGIGGGFFGDMVGSTSQGEVIGQINSGELFAQYNSGNVYTKGQNVELVETKGTVTPMYAATSTEATVYAKGTINLVNGSAHVSFNAAYALMLSDSPVVTATPNGECNGLYISSVDDKGFTVKELMGGTSSAVVSWIAVGNRVDNNPVDRATEMVTAPTFERNVQQVLYSDGNLEGAAKAIWWDGTTIRFDELPAHLTIVDRSEK